MAAEMSLPPSAMNASTRISIASSVLYGSNSMMSWSGSAESTSLIARSYGGIGLMLPSCHMTPILSFFCVRACWKRSSFHGIDGV